MPRNAAAVSVAKVVSVSAGARGSLDPSVAKVNPVPSATKAGPVPSVAKASPLPSDRTASHPFMKRQRRYLHSLHASPDSAELQDLMSSTGNREQFANKLRPIAGRLVRFEIATLRLRSGFAEDGTQEVVIRCVDGVTRIHATDDGSFRAWIRGIVRHVLVDFARRRIRADRIEAVWSGTYHVARSPNEPIGRFDVAESLIDSRADDPVEHAIANENRDTLASAIGHLTNARRDAVIRRVVRGDSYAVIAECHHVSESTARRRAEEGLGQLARILRHVES